MHSIDKATSKLGLSSHSHAGPSHLDAAMTTTCKPLLTYNPFTWCSFRLSAWFNVDDAIRLAGVQSGATPSAPSLPRGRWGIWVSISIPPLLLSWWQLAHWIDVIEYAGKHHTAGPNLKNRGLLRMIGWTALPTKNQIIRTTRSIRSSRSHRCLSYSRLGILFCFLSVFVIPLYFVSNLNISLLRFKWLPTLYLYFWRPPARINIGTKSYA